MSASSGVIENEFVKEFLINHAKFGVLISELLTIEFWKEHIFSQMSGIQPDPQQSPFEPKTSFPLYLVLMHEATLVNLLESALFHEDAMTAAEDGALDLEDYCYRKLTTLLNALTTDGSTSSTSSSGAPSPAHPFTDVALVTGGLLVTTTPVDSSLSGGSRAETTFGTSATIRSDGLGPNMLELVHQHYRIDYELSLKCISLYQYIIDHLSHLSLSVTDRALRTHEAPLLFVQLLELAPWIRRSPDGSRTWRYTSNRWVLKRADTAGDEAESEEDLKLNKFEAQCWLALYNMLLTEPACRKYEVNSFKKQVLLRLRPRLDDRVLDQMPALIELKRYLEQLALTDPPAPHADLLIEQLPETRARLEREYPHARCRTIARRQCAAQFALDEHSDAVRAQAERWLRTFDLDALALDAVEAPRCAQCGKPGASKRCSRCQTEAYCGRECQVKHWKKHKAACDLAFQAKQSNP